MDVTHPAFQVAVTHYGRWQGTPTTWTGVMSGQVTKRFDAARTLTLNVPNVDGRAAEWKVGDRVVVRVGWNALEPLPIFDGFVAPGRGLGVGIGMKPTLRVFAVDAVGSLEKDDLYIRPDAVKPAGGDETTYAGWEVTRAIADVMETSKAGAAGYFGSFAAVKGTSPARSVGTSFEEPVGLQTRKAYIDKLLAEATDDETDADAPRRYHYWMTADAAGVPAVYLQKERAPAADPVVRTVNPTTEFADLDVDTRSDQATAFLAQSSVDGAVWVRYEDDDATARYGRIEARGTRSTGNTDELLAYARRQVNFRRYPVRSLKVAVRDGFRHEPNQVVEVTGSRHDANGRFLVMGVEVAFSPRDVRTVLTLASSEELLTEALAAV